MANYVSPGVYTIEKDISDYAPSINTSIVGIVGFAGKGPTNKPILITSQSNLIRTFGEPSENIDGQGLEGSLEILEQTNSLYFVRAANDDLALDASADMAIGSCPAIIVSGSTTFASEGWGVTSSLTLRIQVYDSNGVSQFDNNGGVGKDFIIPAGTATDQAEAIRKIVGGGLDADDIGCFSTDDRTPTTNPATLALSGAIVGSFAGSGASISVSACTGTTFNEANGVAALRATIPQGTPAFGVNGAYVSSVRVWGGSVVTEGTNSVVYHVESLYPGAGYNGGTKTNGDSSGNSISVTNIGAGNFNLTVNQDGTTDESYKCSFDDILPKNSIDMSSISSLL